MARSFQQDNLIGQSNSFLNVLDQVSQIAPLNKPVLIIGERGTGKELIAGPYHPSIRELAMTEVWWDRLNILTAFGQ